MDEDELIIEDDIEPDLDDDPFNYANLDTEGEGEDYDTDTELYDDETINNSSTEVKPYNYCGTNYIITDAIYAARSIHSLQIIRDSESIINYLATEDSNDVKVDFTGRNTWNHFRLIPSSRPVINPPEFRSSFIEIPGADDFLDASTLLTGGYPLYGRRKGDIEFYVTRDYDSYYTWSKVYSNMMSFLHGQIVKCVLMDDPAFYYRGRMTVNQWRSEKDWSKIVLNYDFEPYKYAVFSTADEWLWDPFDFVEGVITHPKDFFGENGGGFVVKKGSEVPNGFFITAGSMRAHPTIIVTNPTLSNGTEQKKYSN